MVGLRLPGQNTSPEAGGLFTRPATAWIVSFSVSRAYSNMNSALVASLQCRIYSEWENEGGKESEGILQNVASDYGDPSILQYSEMIHPGGPVCWVQQSGIRSNNAYHVKSRVDASDFLVLWVHMTVIVRGTLCPVQNSLFDTL